MSREAPLTKPATIVWREIKSAAGPEVREGDIITVLYRVALSEDNLNSGTYLESTYGPDVPVEIRVSRDTLLQGVYDVVVGMRAGGSIRKALIPSSAAYGHRGWKDVPPDADLYVEICVSRISARQED